MSVRRPSIEPSRSPVDAHRERGPAARMRRLLLDRAMEIINSGGHVPSVSEVAVAAGVSRATAYRYFPTRSKLIAAVVDLSLGPVRTSPPAPGDGAERVERLFESTFSRFKEFEPQMRAALQLALEHSALEKAGLLKEEPYRRGYRVGLLRDALAPLKGRLTPRVHGLLCKSLSLVYGIEAYVVLKDIWGARDAEVETVARWMAAALVEHALAAPPPTASARRGRGDPAGAANDGNGNGHASHRSSAAAAADGRGDGNAQTVAVAPNGRRGSAARVRAARLREAAAGLRSGTAKMR